MISSLRRAPRHASPALGLATRLLASLLAASLLAACGERVVVGRERAAPEPDATNEGAAGDVTTPASGVTPPAPSRRPANPGEDDVDSDGDNDEPDEPDDIDSDGDDDGVQSGDDDASPDAG